jgi:biopolymer transport protein ExbD
VLVRCLLLGVLAVACVDHGPGPQGKKVDVSARILRAAPADITKFETPLGDSIVYLGNKVDQARVAPGGTVTITHYWKVLKPVGSRWRPFGLVRGPPNTPDFMNLVPTDMQAAYPPAKWRAGDLIEDAQQIVIRPDWRAQTATVLVGLIEVGKHGTLDRMTATGPNTQDNAIVAATLQIDLARAPPPKGTIHLSRAKGAITIDGLANDPGWAGIPQSAEFATAEGGSEPNGKATGRMTWDDQYLYAFVNVVDTDIFSPYKKHDDPVWKADCVEMFVDADGNQRGYIELQVNPNNTTFDSWFASTRAQPGDVTWESGMVTAVKVNGTPDKAGDGDTGWDVEIGIPWTAIRGRDPEMRINLPPKQGDRWRLNVVRVDKRGETITAATWNRISIADFHALNRMLNVVFADEAGNVVPGEVSPAAPPPVDPNIAVTLATDEAQGVVIEVKATGPAIVAGKPTADDEMASALELLADGNDKIAVTIKAAKAVPHAKVMAVVDQVREAGLTELAFVAPTTPPTPAPGGVAVEVPPGVLTLVVGPKRALAIAGKPLADRALDATFRAVATRDKMSKLVLEVDQSIPHAQVVAILDRARAAGISKLALAPGKK